MIDSLPHLRPFVSSLYDCRYAAFFQVRLAACLPGPGNGCVALRVMHGLCLFGAWPCYKYGLVCYRPAGSCCAFASPQLRTSTPSPSLTLPPARPAPQAFAGLTDAIRADEYLHPHFRFYMREVRAVAYAQVRPCSCQNQNAP